jgi:hypothetical protein
MAKFDLSDYETVEQRLTRFWAAHPNGRTWTDMVYRDERSFIVKGEIYFDKDDLYPTATGYAEEIVGASPVNRTSALENCETSALGRALANCNFASEGKRPSRTEMEKVDRYSKEPRMAVTKPKTYTEADVKQAEDIMTLLPTVTDIGVLRDLFQVHAGVLDLPLNGTTLKDLFNTRAQELKND